jgi:hypothetical protein
MSNNPIELLIATGAALARFPATSRYYGLEVASHTEADGSTVPYLRRRFVPAPEALTLLSLHEVRQGERLDQIAGKILGDPELFWRICDANRALLPADLTASIGTQLRITLPQDLTGADG